MYFLSSSDYPLTFYFIEIYLTAILFYCYSVTVVSDSLWSHGLYHIRLPCPSPTPRVCSDSCSSSRSVMPSNHLILCRPLLLTPSIFPSIRVFSNESVFASGGQNIGVSALVSVLPMNIQDCFHLGLIGWISLQIKGLSRVFSNTTIQKHQFFGAQLSSQFNSHIHKWPLEKP